MREELKKAQILRALSLIATSHAGSGHPTSCLSAADIVSVLFDHYFSYDVNDPKHPNNDRFLLSKGHAAPLLYAAFALSGVIPRKDLLSLRNTKSRLEGHPTPRFPYIDVATGSLGQGLSAAAGIAYLAKKENKSHKTYALLGDGELAEGQIWEACNFSSYYGLGNLIVIVDVNGLGQTGKTMFSHQGNEYEKRFSAFGFATMAIDGHHFGEIEEALSEAINNKTEKPFALIAKTVKGKGVSFLEGREDFHGKAVPKDQLSKALDELGLDEDIVNDDSIVFSFRKPKQLGSFSPRLHPFGLSSGRKLDKGVTLTQYRRGEEVATREAFGHALIKVGSNESVYVLDGDVSNSTYTDEFKKEYPERFIQCFIAEQNMVGVALGLWALGKIPFIATFSAFFTRAYDQIRMAHISRANITFVGSHAGVSVGEDGPSQMGLEDMSLFHALPNSVVLHPSDAVSCYKLTFELVKHKGISYLRTLRPKTPILYDDNETFKIGGSKVLRHSKSDAIVVVACGITVHEALKAYELLQKEGIHICVIDAYSVKPLDTDTIRTHVRQTQEKIVVTIEDHYIHGGLGDMVLSELKDEDTTVVKLGIDSVPFSGKQEELLEEFGIGSNVIARTVRHLING